MNYIRAGILCTRCLEGQAFWKWEPFSQVHNYIPPFKTIRVLKCFHCSYILEWGKDNLK